MKVGVVGAGGVGAACMLAVSSTFVEAQVLGEHGTSEVFVWSGVRVAGIPLSTMLAGRHEDEGAFRKSVEEEVRYANIAIIEGNDASLYGVGVVCARIAEAVLQNEGIVVPIGAFSHQHQLTLSLPGQIGAHGLQQFYPPALSAEETQLLDKSVAALRKAQERLAEH